jgi:hypothetical protein
MTLVLLAITPVLMVAAIAMSLVMGRMDTRSSEVRAAPQARSTGLRRLPAIQRCECFAVGCLASWQGAEERAGQI